MVVTGLQTVMPGSPVKTVPYVPEDPALLGKAADTETGELGEPPLLHRPARSSPRSSPS